MQGDIDANLQPGAGGLLKIKEATRVVNDKRLKAFKKAGGFELKTQLAASKQCDTLLFHGCSSDVAANIQSEGLLLKYFGAHGGNLGKGLYGAPDPRKSVKYCGASPIGKFLFVCRFNLSGAKHGMPDGTYHEYCTFDESKLVVLWMVKLA